MNLLKKLLASILFLTMALTTASAAADDSNPQIDIPESFYSRSLGNVGYMLYGALSLQAGLPVAFNGKEVCNQPDATCLRDAKTFHMNGYFKNCSQVSNSPCVESIEARQSGNSPWIEGTFIEEISYRTSAASVDHWVADMKRIDPAGNFSGMNQGLGWPYQTSTGIPASAEGPLVFTIPNVSHAGGSNTYVVDARFEIDSPVSSGKLVSNDTGNLVLSIRPTTIRNEAPGTFAPVRGARSTPEGLVGLSGAVGGSINRTFMTETRSGIASAFGNDETEFRLNVRLPQSTVGWFHGRLLDPSIQIKSVNSSQISVSVSGKPTKIPVTSIWMPFAEAEKLDPKLINPNWDKYWRDQVSSGKTSSGDEWNGFTGLDDRFTKWFPYLAPKAKGSANLWMINTLPSNQTASPCFKNAGQLVGMLTTNAMAYQAGPPNFSNGFLNYKVAGVHLDSNGDVYSGNYNLIIRSDVARCLYGFNQAPISASISVVDTENGSTTATTEMSEKDGWVRFSANNFTFSTKEVRVKIAQSKYKKISGFVKNGSSISQSIKNSIKVALLENSGVTFTCLGNYYKSSSKGLASARASSTCAAAKSLNPAIKTEVLIYSTRDSKLDGQVLVARR